MQLILLVIHLMLALALIVVVLLQRSEGGALGIGGGSGGGGMGGFLSGRATANLLTRATAVIATMFIVTSLALAIIGGGGRQQAGSIINQTPATGTQLPAQQNNQLPGQQGGESNQGQPTLPVE